MPRRPSLPSFWGNDMVAVWTYEIPAAKKREWWGQKIGKPLVLEGVDTGLCAVDAKVVGPAPDHEGEKMIRVEVTYWVKQQESTKVK